MKYRTTYDVVEACARATGCSVASLTTPGRVATADMPTHAAIVVVANKHLKKSLPVIGQTVQRDRSTLWYRLNEWGQHRETLRIAGKILIELQAPTWRERVKHKVQEAAHAGPSA